MIFRLFKAGPLVSSLKFLSYDAYNHIEVFISFNFVWGTEISNQPLFLTSSTIDIPQQVEPLDF
jgi:hypothetical protein